MGRYGLEAGRELAGVMAHQEQQPDFALTDLEDSARHGQRRARSGFPEKPDVLFTDHQGGLGLDTENPGHTQFSGHTAQRLHRLGHIEADVQMAHAVAFPGRDTASPDFDFRHFPLLLRDPA